MNSNEMHVDSLEESLLTSNLAPPVLPINGPDTSSAPVLPLPSSALPVPAVANGQPGLSLTTGDIPLPTGQAIAMSSPREAEVTPIQIPAFPARSESHSRATTLIKSRGSTPVLPQAITPAVSRGSTPVVSRAATPVASRASTPFVLGSTMAVQSTMPIGEIPDVGGLDVVQTKKRPREQAEEDREEEKNGGSSKRLRSGLSDSPSRELSVVSGSPSSILSPTPTCPEPPKLSGILAGSLAFDSMPDSSPTWSTNAMSFFHRLDNMPPAWKGLINKWLALEVRGSFGVGSKRRLAAKGRPDCVGYWISTARPPLQRADKVGDLDAFEACFLLWWRTLQPAFRGAASSTPGPLVQTQPPPGLDQPWDKIHVVGSNGIVSVLAALCFWGIPIAELPQNNYRAKQNHNAHLSRWMAAVQDVSFVLGAM